MPLAATAQFLLKQSKDHPDEKARDVHSLLLNTLIRHAPGPVYVSKAAQAKADLNQKIKKNLVNCTWHEQAKVMCDPGRKIFAYEHFFPVAELRHQMDALKEPTESQFRTILLKASVVWILKTEDKELNRLGYRVHRPDPDKAYREAGIELVGR